jgi:2-hydroxychromene-2-carboxylate isomerase
MSRQIAFYFDFRSPYSYLASTQLAPLAARTGSDIAYTPIDVLEVMKLVGNSPTTIISAVKGKYAGADLRRWATRYGVPFGRNPGFGAADAVGLLAGAAAAAELGEAPAYTTAVFQAAWAGTAATAADEDLARVLADGGVGQVAAILAGREAGRATVAENVKAAAEAGVFGAPSFITGGELFFGNDRLDFLETALAA